MIAFSKSAAFAVLLSSLYINQNEAFTVNPSSQYRNKAFHVQNQSRDTKTRLYIIGPMIRKMRDNKEKKKRALASDEERQKEAPGLKIGTGVWKWPPVWPYAPDFFLRPKEEEAEKDLTAGNPMAAAMSAMGGGGDITPPGLKDASELAKAEAEAKLDTNTFWSVEKADELTELDEEAVEKLKNHYSFYLRDGMSVLELGAAEKSYLPDGIKLGRHVGVGLNKGLMDKNPALSETIVADLNNVVEEMGVDSDELNQLGSDTFDVILIANTIEFLTQPREVFKSCWRALKPGGIMMVAFPEREALKEKFGDAQTKMWRGYNDDQHMWMAGSFFQFSAGDGWEGLKGFDISPESAKKEDEGLLARFSNTGKSNNMFVCQATKASVSEEIDPNDPEKSFSSLMWMTPTMESRDKLLVTPRLSRVYLHYKDQPARQKAIQENVETLPSIYEALIKMDQFAFPFNLQATLAADLLSDPDFEANDKQMEALKMGLGLKTPSPDFWAPVGQLTFSMDAEDKVNLLAHIVPRFGSENSDQNVALETFITGLKPTIAVVKSKCNELSDADATLVASELAASELLVPGRSTKEEFAAWIGELTDEELMDYAKARKSVREEASAELRTMKEEREAEKKRLEDTKKKFEEQVEKARKERTMVFNEKTGKMEEITK